MNAKEAIRHLHPAPVSPEQQQLIEEVTAAFVTLIETLEPHFYGEDIYQPIINLKQRCVHAITHTRASR